VSARADVGYFVIQCKFLSELRDGEGPSASAAPELDLHASAVQLLGCSFTAVRGRRDEVTPRSPDVSV